MRAVDPPQLDPGHDWAGLFGWLGELLRRDYDWSSDVGAIDVPVMLVFADADAVRDEHLVEVSGSLGGGSATAASATAASIARVGRRHRWRCCRA